MQCALHKSKNFTVFWTWVQFLIQAWIPGLILSGFRGLCKPVSSPKEGKIIVTSASCSCWGVNCCCTHGVLSVEPGAYLGLSVPSSKKETRRHCDRQHGPMPWIDHLWGRLKIPRFGESHEVEVKGGP